MSLQLSSLPKAVKSSPSHPAGPGWRDSSVQGPRATFQHSICKERGDWVILGLCKNCKPSLVLLHGQAEGNLKWEVSWTGCLQNTSSFIAGVYSINWNQGGFIYFFFSCSSSNSVSVPFSREGTGGFCWRQRRSDPAKEWSSAKCICASWTTTW